MRKLYYFITFVLLLSITGSVYPDPISANKAKTTLTNRLDKNIVVHRQNSRIRTNDPDDLSQLQEDIKYLLQQNGEITRKINNIRQSSINKNIEIEDLKAEIEQLKSIPLEIVIELSDEPLVDGTGLTNGSDDAELINGPDDTGLINGPDDTGLTNGSDDTGLINGPDDTGLINGLKEQIQKDVNSGDWTGTAEFLKTVFGIETKEYRLLQDVKNNDILPLKAAKEGNTDLIGVLVDNGLDINTKFGEWGDTILHEAAGLGQYTVVRYLISRGADIHVKGAYDWTPLLKAAYSRHRNIVEILLQNGANCNVAGFYGKTPLHWAVHNDDLQLVKLLIGRKCNKLLHDQENRIPLQYAQELGRSTDMLRLLS